MIFLRSAKFLLELNFVRNCQEIHSREYFLTLFHFTSFAYFLEIERVFLKYPISRSAVGFYFMKPVEGIKVKTDRLGFPMWLLWSRRIIPFKLYFCSHKRVSKGFSLFVRDDRRFCENYFQQGQIVYQTPIFDQYLF